MTSRPARYRLHRRDRQDFAQVRKPVDHPRCVGRGCSTGFAQDHGSGAARKHPQQGYLQVNTTNILFVCGGAFTGLEKIISARGRSSSIGFSAKVIAPDDRGTGEILREVEPGVTVESGETSKYSCRKTAGLQAVLDDLLRSSRNKGTRAVSFTAVLGPVGLI